MFHFFPMKVKICKSCHSRELAEKINDPGVIVCLNCDREIDTRKKDYTQTSDGHPTSFVWKESVGSNEEEI
ncbi:MAG: hypothetical protein WC511_02135 [Candidatus Pacearchaeota archaeon]